MRTAWVRYRADALLLALLLALACLFFWPVTSGLGYIPRGGGDLASFLWPTYSYAAQAYTSGRIPLWNPGLYAGMPFAADPQTAAFYPLNLMAYVVAPGFPYVALEWLVVAHVWLAGVGMYALLRAWLGPRSERVAALTGAVALMFCDVFVIHVGNYNIIAAASWLPWALAGLHRAFGGAGAWSRAGAAVALALSVLAGHAQLTLMVWIAVGTYAGVMILLGAQESRAVAWRRLWMSTETLAAAALLAAVAWMPALELQAYTARAALTYEQASEFSLPWAGLAGLFSPLLLGRGSGDFWAPWPRVEAGYVGVATLVLAALALTRRPDRLSFYLAVLGIGGLVLALGPSTPVHGWVYDFIGVLRGLRVPARFIFLTDFALAGLAGLGMQALIGAGRRWWVSVGVVAGLGAVALYGGYSAASAIATPQREVWGVVSLTVGLLALAAVFGAWGRAATAVWPRRLLWVILVADLIGMGSWVEIDFSDPTRGYRHPVAIGFLRERPTPTRVDGAALALAPDAAARFGYDDIGGIYNPLGLAAMQTYRDALGSRGSASYDFLGAQWVVADKGQPPADDPTIVPVFVDDPALDIYLNLEAQPRVTVRAAADVVAAGGALDRLLSSEFDIGRSVIIEPVAALENGRAGPAVPPRWTPAEGVATARVQLEAYAPEHLRIRVTTNGPTWLVIADAWYPGWRATIDGVPAPIFRANLAFRALALASAGEHVVDLVYLPATQLLGAVLAVLGLMLLAGDLVAERWRRRTAPVGRPPAPPHETPLA